MHLLSLMEEYGTSIDILSVSLSHRSSPGLWTEDTLIAMPAQFGVEEQVVLICFNLLQRIAHNS